MTTLLSLDTSSHSTGYAVFHNGVFYKSGIIDKSKSKKDDNLNDMIKSISELMSAHRPQIVVAEEVDVFRNHQTTRKLCELIGAVRGICLDRDIFFMEMTPNEWRSKLDMLQKKLKRDDYKAIAKAYVKDNFGLDVDRDDESDAICLGVAYCKLFE